MHRNFLSLVNNLLTMHSGTAFIVFVGVAISTFAIIAAAASAWGAKGSPVLLALVVVISLLFASSLLLLRSARWNLISWGISKELDWFVKREPTLLLGIGPGGAIIAGMIAKQLGVRNKKEPRVLVIDRFFRREGRSLSVEVGKADLSPGQKIILVTPEVHSGNTIKLVSGKLDSEGIVHGTFSFLVSPHSSFEVNHFVLTADQRGILPWRDAPEREAMN